MHVMVDLETLGTAVTSPIVAIGAVSFCKRDGKYKIVSEFYQKVKWDSAIAKGDLSADTLLWWMKQNDAARLEISDQSNAVTLYEALHNFTAWVNGHGEDGVEVWGNGASFDNAILSYAYKQIDSVEPWKFWNNRCYRTIKNLHRNIPYSFTGVAHNALDDAKNQAEHLISILENNYAEIE